MNSDDEHVTKHELHEVVSSVVRDLANLSQRLDQMIELQHTVITILHGHQAAVRTNGHHEN